MVAKIVQLVAFMLTISAALALTCYKCDSSQSKTCNYGFASFVYDTVDCTQEGGLGFLNNYIPQQCVKLVAQDKDGKEYVARGCMPHLGGACKVVADTLGFFGSLDGSLKDLQCYPCNGDKCNAANKVAGYTFVGVILAAFIFML